LHARLERKRRSLVGYYNRIYVITNYRSVDYCLDGVDCVDGSVGSMKFYRKRSLREGEEKSLMQGIICRPAVRFPVKAAGLRPDTLRTDQIY